MKEKQKIGPILYIHGFNSGPGEKVKSLQKAFPNEIIICPQLIDNNASKSLEILEKVIEEQKPKHIIGTSMGGFYAMYLSIRHSDPCYYVINPSFNPHKTLEIYIGKQKENYITKNTYIVTEEFIQTLRNIKLYIDDFYGTSMLYGTDFYLGRHDTLIDYTDFCDFIYSFEEPVKLRVTDNDHRYSDLTEVISDIKENSFL